MTFEVNDSDSAEARAAMSSYFAELDDRFPGGFDAREALRGDSGAFEAPGGCFVLARHRSEVVGCGAVRSIDGRTGEIKRMWIARDWRGLGLARRLLADLEARSRTIGHSVVKLDTNATLTAAIQLYESAGYRRIERYNDNPDAELWFEKSLSST